MRRQRHLDAIPTVHHSAKSRADSNRQNKVMTVLEPCGAGKVAGLACGRGGRKEGWPHAKDREPDALATAVELPAEVAMCGGIHCRRGARDRGRWGRPRRKSGRKPELRVRAETRSQDDRATPSIHCANALSRSPPEDRCKERRPRDA